jgi:hypothetical protein
VDFAQETPINRDGTQESGRSIYGRITEILAASEANANSLAVAVLDVFDLKAARHPVLGMPVLARSSGQASHAIVPVKVGPCTETLGLAKY